MTEHKGRQGEWPVVKREPDGYVLTPDTYTRSDRGAAGPLRFGTVQNGVGPKGRSRAEGDARASDYGMDRVSPREFDPMGTSIERYRNPRRDAELISSNPAPRSQTVGSGAGRPWRGVRPDTPDRRRSDSEKA